MGRDEPRYPNPEATFLKEVTYKSTNIKEPGELTAPSGNLDTAFRYCKLKHLLFFLSGGRGETVRRIAKITSLNNTN